MEHRESFIEWLSWIVSIIAIVFRTYVVDGLPATAGIFAVMSFAFFLHKRNASEKDERDRYVDLLASSGVLSITMAALLIMDGVSYIKTSTTSLSLWPVLGVAITSLVVLKVYLKRVKK